jgi:hypothetical protein
VIAVALASLLAAAGPRAVKMAIDCAAPAHAINPLIYGIAYSFRGESRDTAQFELGATARRWGGNSSTRYNWELGNAWNTASDWFFRNVNYTPDAAFSWDKFLQTQAARGLKTALTLPTLGWVAKDTKSVSFPVSVFGPQQSTAPEDPEAGNGVSPGGKLIPPGPPERTSVASTPESIARWVREIRARGRGVEMYILDNEPSLWNSTHRDVHPAPLTYDELLRRTLEYGAAVRKADPQAVIAGPAEWGWTGYPPVRRLLRDLREHRRKTGVRILDVVDVHFYPQGKDIGVEKEGATDPDTAARRIRSTRGLWDPTYRDESWIGQPVRLIPRLREWIDEAAPGLGISIGEYNFGAEGHMSGGLALAEALGRFGVLGITSAFYWTYPARGTPAFWAFRAYRNYDGKGARFGDTSLKARSSDPSASIFAAREAGRITAVLLNFDPAATLVASISGCGDLAVARAFSYTGGEEGFSPAPAGSMEQRLPPWSVTVLELAPRKK